MKNLSKYLLLFLVLILANKEVHAQNDTSYFVHPMAFDMGVSDVTHGTLVDIDSIVQFTVSFVPKISDTIRIKVHFPDNIAPANRVALEEMRDSIVWVDSGTSYTFNFPMKIYDYGSSLLEAYVSPVTPRTDMLDLGTSAVQVQHDNPSSFTVTKTTDNPVIPDSGSFAFSAPPLGIYNWTFKASGKVMYLDPRQFGGTLKGLYGAQVVLMFRKHGDCSDCPRGWDYSGLSHPIATTCTEGVHFSKIDINGNFSFDFSVNGVGHQNWSDDYYDFILFVTNWNDAIFLEPFSQDLFSDFHHCVTRAFPIKGTCVNNSSVFGKGIRYCISLSSLGANINKSNIKISIPNNYGEGSALRNTELSQDFYRDRPVSSSVPSQINTLITSDKGAGQGEFISSPLKILYSPFYVDYATYYDHEYGHYASNHLWGGFGTISHNMKEGWANFYAFAVRNYATAKYSEDLVGWNHNSEEGPFMLPRWSYYNDLNRNGHWDPPYETPIIDVAYDVTNSFLWNLYDKYNDLNFKAPIYNGADNDDVSEQSLFFSTTPTGDEGDFLSALQNASGVSIDEGTSMKKIFDCMYGLHHNGLNGGGEMRPAQIKNLSGTGSSLTGKVTLNWNLQEYSGSPRYDNHSDGVHVYQSDGLGGWNLVATSDIGDESIEFFPYEADLTFKAAAYNSAGDAWDALQVTPSWSKISIENNLDDRFILKAVTPSPFKDNINISFAIGSTMSNTETYIKYEVVNTLGVVVVSGLKDYSSGEHSIRLNTAMLPVGMYNVKLTLSSSESNIIATQSYKICKLN